MKLTYLLAFVCTFASAQEVSVPSLVCTGDPAVCKKIDVPGKLNIVSPKNVVIISHGSQGVDSRMTDYAEALKKVGISSLILDHWTPRGIGVTHNNYTDASKKGGNELNQAYDVLLAISYLRSKGFEKFGMIGESQGGIAAQWLMRVPTYSWLQFQTQKVYGEHIRLSPPDAIVGLYPSCIIRDTEVDRFIPKPFLFVTGSYDDETPSAACESYTAWMNERGANGNAKIEVLKGYYHSFDAPFGANRMTGQNFVNCDILMDKTEIKSVKQNITLPRTYENLFKALNGCAGRGYTTGHSGNRNVGVTAWLTHFQQHLKD